MMKKTPLRALVIGDGPSYHSVSGFDWGEFDGLIVSTHFYRHRAAAVVTIDPRGFEQKERRAIGKTRLVVAMSDWANNIRLKRFVPRRHHKDVEWAWCSHPVMTSGVYAIEWAAQQGCEEIYTIGVDLSPGYHKSLDTQRPILAKILGSLDAKGVRVYKRSPASTLPVTVRDPAEHLPEAPPPPREHPRHRRVLYNNRDGRPPQVVQTTTTMASTMASSMASTMSAPRTGRGRRHHRRTHY